MESLSPFDIFYILETIGILSFALSGVILAKRKKFDLVGVYIIACVTAFGGGTIRDVILDIQPVYWIDHHEYPLALLIIVTLICLVDYYKPFKIQEDWLIIPDALGLSLFVITTAQMAYNSGLPTIVIAILSTIVASFGGVIRDIFCQETPIIFKKNSSLYASLAFLGACLFVLLQTVSFFELPVTMLICVLVIFFSRLVTKKYNIVLKI